jgi:hypothetical protein
MTDDESNVVPIGSPAPTGIPRQVRDLAGTMHIFKQLYSQTPDQNLL